MFKRTRSHTRHAVHGDQTVPSTPALDVIPHPFGAWCIISTSSVNQGPQAQPRGSLVRRPSPEATELSSCPPLDAFCNGSRKEVLLEHTNTRAPRTCGSSRNNSDNSINGNGNDKTDQYDARYRACLRAPSPHAEHCPSRKF